MTPLQIDLHPGQPEMPDDTQLLLSLYTLNSAFNRIVTVLSLLNSTSTLSEESALAKTASLEALRTTITAEVRETLGESALQNLEQFSQNLRRMEHELIEECMAPRYSVGKTRTDA